MYLPEGHLSRLPVGLTGTFRALVRISASRTWRPEASPVRAVWEGRLALASDATDSEMRYSNRSECPRVIAGGRFLREGRRDL